MRATDAIQFVAFATNGDIILSYQRLRVWAHRYPGIHAGKDQDNRSLYNVDAILAHTGHGLVAEHTNDA